LRILFTFAGGTGHFLPLVPIARAAERHGHVVAFAGQEGMIPTVEAAGFPAFATGGASLRPGGARIDLRPLDPDREARALRDSFAGRIARERADALLALHDEWQPDLLVRDEVDFGAAVIADRLRLPRATVLCIAAGSFVQPDLIEEPLDELRAEHGLPPDPELAVLQGDLILSPFPPSLREPSSPLPAGAHALRWAPPEAPVEAPAWLAGLVEPVVYVTLGTIFNLESGDLFERVLAGLRGLDVEVVVTVGRDLDPSELGPQPANVHVERYLPQALLLPRCTVIVSHGGSGSVVGALAHGLPMVLIPLGADQPLNAARCAELGVAELLDAGTSSAEDVRAAVACVLSDPLYRTGAERIREEIAGLPGPEHAVRLLERLAAAS
jgi:UDP:flavonoid glycosyltransferase YjiC (YdhE family)